jgi:hypothetical protein
MSTTVKDLAKSHSAHLAGNKQRLYLMAVHAGMKAHRAGDDTSRYVRSLIDGGKAASVAGFLEGVAAARLTLHPASRRCSCAKCLTILSEREQLRVALCKQQAGAT